MNLDIYFYSFNIVSDGRFFNLICIFLFPSPHIIGFLLQCSASFLFSLIYWLDSSPSRIPSNPVSFPTVNSNLNWRFPSTLLKISLFDTSSVYWIDFLQLHFKTIYFSVFVNSFWPIKSYVSENHYISCFLNKLNCLEHVFAHIGRHMVLFFPPMQE